MTIYVFSMPTLCNVEGSDIDLNHFLRYLIKFYYTSDMLTNVNKTIKVLLGYICCDLSPLSPKTIILM